MSYPPFIRFALSGLFLLAAVEAWAVEEATPKKSEAALAVEATRFADSYVRDWKVKQPANLKDLIAEIAKAVGCSDAAKETMLSGVAPLAEKKLAFWVSTYRSYYLTHYEKYQNGEFWDDYPQMRSSDTFRKGLADLTSQWESLLKSALTAEEMDKWQAEYKSRRERREKAFKLWLDYKLGKLEENVKKEYEGRFKSLAKAASISDARKEELHKGVEAAFKKRMEVCRDQAEKSEIAWREDFVYFTEKSLKGFEKPETDKDTNADLVRVGRAMNAANDVFEQQVLQRLNSEEKAALAKTEKERRTRITKIAQDMADANLAQMESNSRMAMDGRIASLATGLALNDERKKSFEEKIRTAEKGINAEWKKSFVAWVSDRIEKDVKQTDAEERLKQMEARRFWYSHQEVDRKADQDRRKMWASVIDSVLKPDEKSKWSEYEKRQRGRRISMLVHLTVSELDRKLSFQSEQRQQIEQQLTEAVKPLADYDGDLMESMQYQIEGVLLFAGALDHEKVNALLDENQRKAFDEVFNRYHSNWAELAERLDKKT